MSLSPVQSLRQPYGNPTGTLRNCSRLHAFMWGRVLHDGNLQHLDDACMLSGPCATEGSPHLDNCLLLCSREVIG